MRLFTHNFLKSNVKGTEKGYPLNIEVAELQVEETTVDKQFLLKLLPKINYPALKSAVMQISNHCEPPLPAIPEELDVSDGDRLMTLDFRTLSSLYKVLFDVYLVEGFLICPDTGRRFPVKQRIPNMILHEDEI
mmetsp:Transcript_8890/g.19103  ORF Transcript_8890/g.19103 Transcript_8890/m.19103 type:complete len:134 (-) Transcript_8890:114-515(-)